MVMAYCRAMHVVKQPSQGNVETIPGFQHNISAPEVSTVRYGLFHLYWILNPRVIWVLWKQFPLCTIIRVIVTLITYNSPSYWQHQPLPELLPKRAGIPTSSSNLQLSTDHSFSSGKKVEQSDTACCSRKSLAMEKNADINDENCWIIAYTMFQSSRRLFVFTTCWLTYTLECKKIYQSSTAHETLGKTYETLNYVHLMKCSPLSSAVLFFLLPGSFGCWLVMQITLRLP